MVVHSRDGACLVQGEVDTAGFQPPGERRKYCPGASEQRCSLVLSPDVTLQCHAVTCPTLLPHALIHHGTVLHCLYSMSRVLRRHPDQEEFDDVHVEGIVGG